MTSSPLFKFVLAWVVVLLGSSAVAAQDVYIPPGLYAHTIKHETYLQTHSGNIDLPLGQAAYANEQGGKPLDKVPSFFEHDRTLAPGQVDNLSACGLYPGSAPPIGDLPLQSDFVRFDQVILNEIERFLRDGYPPASVMMHAASQGIPIDQVLYAAVRTEPQQADELYTTALQLMAFLPGWTCTSSGDHGLYDPVYNVNDLPDPRKVRNVAQRYFDDRARLAQFPDWPHGEFHMMASADELLDILSRTETRYWYRPGPPEDGPGANPRDSVLIALYPDDDQIVIDTTADRIREWQKAGRQRISVTFFYNFDYQEPISRFPTDVTLEDLMDAFFEDGTELTAVPLWTVGDYHVMVSGEELGELFDLPDSDQIDPARYQTLADQLAAKGFNKKPVLVTLLSSGDYHRLAEPDRVRVALDMGIQRFPVVLFYHRLDRQPCGAPALCFDRLCKALVCAGGDPSVCLSPAAAGAVRQESFEAPSGGGGGIPPPPPVPLCRSCPPPPASPS